jgi:hypothetical protein
MRLRVSLSIAKVERRYVIRFVDAGKFGLEQIVAELASVYAEQVHAKNAVEYRIHEVKLERRDMEGEANPRRLPRENVDKSMLAIISDICLRREDTLFSAIAWQLENPLSDLMCFCHGASACRDLRLTYSKRNTFSLVTQQIEDLERQSKRRCMPARY